MAILEIQSQRQISLWLSFENTVHLPGNVKANEIAQQGAAGAESVPARKRTYAASLDLHKNARRRVDVGIKHAGSLQLIVSAVPGGTQINELYQLEIAEEGIVDRPVEERAEERHPHFAVDHDIIVAVCRILLEAAQIYGQGLVGIVNVGIRFV